MPVLQQIRYEPNDRKWWDAIEDVGNKERQQRKRAIDEAWLYYYGDHPAPLKTSPQDPNYNVILNFAGQALDTLVGFLGVPSFEVAGGMQRAPNAAGLMETTQSREQGAVEQFWTANDLKLLIVDLLLSGFVSGHNFLKLIPMDGDLPRVEMVDPRFVTTFWAGAQTPLFYRMKWTIGDETRIQDVVPDWLEATARMPEERDAMGIVPFAPQRWWVIEYREQKGGGFAEVGRDEWPFAFSPIIDWKNAAAPYQYYGLTDLRPSALRNNDAANFVATNVQKIIYHHGGPQTVITGGKLADEADSGPGTVIDDLPADAKVFNLEMASDLGNSMNFLNVLRGGFFDGLHVVDKATIKDKLGDMTNFTVRLLYGDQLDAGYMKQMLYGKGLVEVTRRALAMMGAPVETIKDVWPEPLPQDRTATVQQVVSEAELGMTSDETLLKDLGRDPQVEAEQRARQQRTQQTSVAEMLAGLGQRGNLLGAGGRGGFNGQ